MLDQEPAVGRVSETLLGFRSQPFEDSPFVYLKENNGGNQMRVHSPFVEAARVPLVLPRIRWDQPPNLKPLAESARKTPLIKPERTLAFTKRWYQIGVISKKQERSLAKKGIKTMDTTGYQKVYSVNGELHAIVVQVTLEQAGIPVILVRPKNGAYLDILVPQKRVFDAKYVLNSDARDM